MKRLIPLVALFLALGASGAFAQEHLKGALGFHNVDAPLGVRWWLSGQKLGIDAGVGFGSDEEGNEDFSFTAFDVGLPILLKSWDRVHFMVRPGIAYSSQERTVPAGGTDNDVTMVIQGELEAEVFLADNVSVSASQGFRFENFDPAVGGSETDFNTTGANFTELGFHVYLFGH